MWYMYMKVIFHLFWQVARLIYIIHETVSG